MVEYSQHQVRRSLQTGSSNHGHLHHQTGSVRDDLVVQESHKTNYGLELTLVKLRQALYFGSSHPEKKRHVPSCPAVCLFEDLLLYMFLCSCVSLESCV